MNNHKTTRNNKKSNRFFGYLNRFCFGGLLFATVFFCLSLLPSLLPRPSLYQGLISGIAIAIGYAIGTGASTIFRWLVQVELSQKLKDYVWIIFASIAPFAIVIFLILGSQWQDQVRELVGESGKGGQQIPEIIAVSLITWLVILSISRAIRKFNVWLINFIDKYLPRRLSIVLGVSIVVLVGFWLVSGVFLNFLISTANHFYNDKNASTPNGVSQPTSPYRSGSPESLISWDTLGYQGKAFVARGPSQKALSDFSGKPATEQIRVYAGLDSAPTATKRAEVALADLKRTGAFNRPVLILATATGTGWLEPQSVDSLEYIYGGNSAIVAQQYSYLPSWISFLVDKQNATDAGQALFDAVYSEWAKMPVASRPKLIAYGLSLGSFGGQTPYAGVNSLKAMIDGALFVGTPNDTSLWRNITNSRDNGSPEWQPIYQNGNTVKFAASNDDIQNNAGNWQFPRVLYMQHASDPVVWFSFDLLFNEPDWLKEPRGPDVSSKTHWYPIVTFLQVTVDQFFGVTVPNGHGHNYGDTIVNAWASVTNPPDFSSNQAENLQKIITGMPIE